MGGCPITNQVARKALKKLDAQDVTQPNDPHPTFDIVHNGVIVATTGIRRSSTKDIPLRHLNKDLRVSIQFVLGLAHCPKSRNDYLQEIGEIQAPSTDDSTEETSEPQQ